VQGRESLRVYTPDSSSAINTFLTIYPGSSSEGGIDATGNAADIDIYLRPKGNGAVKLNGQKENYLWTFGGTGTGNTGIRAQSSTNANVTFNLDTKGTGSFVVSQDFTRTIATFNGIGDGYLVSSGGTGVHTLKAAGTSTNIDLALATQGAGLLKFGTWTSSADVAITGYITVKSADGTTRKLAVIS
jgi:hypothetical protein